MKKGLKKIKLRTRKKSYQKKAGLPPGSLVYVGEQQAESVTLELIEYTNEEFKEKQLQDIVPTRKCVEPDCVSWINMNGLANLEWIEKSGKIFGLHKLLLEDILNTDHRPKIEEFEDHIFCTLKMLTQKPESNEIETEQISLILGNHYVLSFQEHKGDLFDPVRKRLEAGKGLARNRGADYLLYMLIDVIVDNYFNILENISDRIETLEEEIFHESQPEQLEEIQRIKKNIIYLKKSIFPVRDLVSGLNKSPNNLIQETTKNYFRDVYDHAINLVDNIETYRDWNSELKDIYLSSLSNRMNQIMKVLTVIATIFIPLTFIAGVYGMNFEYMPELGYKYGYFAVWGAMIVVFVGMLVYFRRKKWL